MSATKDRIIGGLKWFGKQVAEKLFDAAWIGVGVAAVFFASLGSLWARLRGNYQISGWALAVGIAAIISPIVLAVLQGFRARKAARSTSVRFKPIPVDDENLQLRWLILRPIDQWIESNDLDTASENYLRTLLDGPFHAANHCSERLASEYILRGDSPILRAECPGCSAMLFNHDEHVEHYTVRREAIAELQRLHRRGMSIVLPRFLLERPQYWKRMRPALKQER